MATVKQYVDLDGLSKFKELLVGKYTDGTYKVMTATNATNPAIIPIKIFLFSNIFFILPPIFSLYNKIIKKYIKIIIFVIIVVIVWKFSSL